MLSVKPRDHHQAERRDDRDRDRDRGDDRRAQAAEEQQHDERGEQRADHEVLEHLRRRRADLDRVIADDVDRVAGRQVLLRARRPRPSRASTTATVFVPVCLRTDSAIAATPLRTRGRLGIFFGRPRRRRRRARAPGGRPAGARRSSPICSASTARPSMRSVRVRRAHLDLAAGHVDVRASRSRAGPRAPTRRSAASRIGSRLTLIWRSWPPRITTWPTPFEALDALLDLLVGEPRQLARSACPAGP